MEEEKDLTLSDLASGNPKALEIIGMIVCKSLQEGRSITFSYNALGQVVLVNPLNVKIEKWPELTKDQLDSLNENDCIAALLFEGKTESEILKYFSTRGDKP